MMTNISFVSDKKLAIGRLIGFALLVCVSIAHAQLWQPAPTFPGQGAGTAILRTDGIVMVQELTEPASQGGQATGNWYELIPDSYGRLWLMGSDTYSPFGVRPALLRLGGSARRQSHRGGRRVQPWSSRLHDVGSYL
jgi:hypothetical protein